MRDNALLCLEIIKNKNMQFLVTINKVTLILNVFYGL